MRIAGNWVYLYRAVDSAGDTIDFMLSPNRDLVAAKQFLQLALHRSGRRPRVVNVDGHPAYASAIAEMKEEGDLGQRADSGEENRSFRSDVDQDGSIVSPDSYMLTD